MAVMPRAFAMVGSVRALKRSAVGDFEENHALIGVKKMDTFLNMERLYGDLKLR